MQPARRTLLHAAAAAGLPLWAGLPGCSTVAPGAAAGGDEARLYRLVNRATWGATDADFERARRLGAEAWITEQLQAGAGPLPAAAQAQIDAYAVQQRTPAALWAEIDAARKAGEARPTEDERKAAQQAFQQSLSKLTRESAQRRMLRALYAPNQVQERLQAFWFNHFNVFQFKANLRVLLADYEERAIRPHALGRFRELLGACTRHPAMLRYLDNEQNAAGRLNENHARELLELHTLGVDSGAYTQKDVQELARVLSGHGTNFGDRMPNLPAELQGQYRREGFYEFNPQRHDRGEKTLLGQPVRGRGAAELDEVLDRLAVHPATARYVSGKLARHFLADEPPPALVDDMAAAWRASEGRIAEVMGVLLRAPAFTDAAWQRFKEPQHYLVSAVRACYGERVLLNPQPLLVWLQRMGQGVYYRVTPDGYPSQAAAWTGSGQLAARLDIARTLGSTAATLFKAEDPPREQPAFPQLARPLYWQVMRPLLAPATREALDAAASPQDWNALLLSSPDFMHT